MKRTAVFFLLFLLLAVLSSFPVSRAEESAEPAISDTVYELRPLLSLKEGEEAVLIAESSYYSGETIYKGNTGLVLSGACALHSASVVISNATGTVVTGQEIAAANNRDIRSARSWVNYVAWGKLATRYQVDFESFNMVKYNASLRNSGMRSDERRANKIETLAEACALYGQDTGIILHFNASGQQNGDAHRHVVVLLGWITEDGAVTDLLISDSNVSAPEGACVRLSQSSLPLSMLGKKALNKAIERGDNLALLMMDYIVTYRYVTLAEGV